MSLMLQETLGVSLYGAFGRAVRASVKARNGEYCAIYAPSLAWILKQEGANYWGTIGPNNFNVLLDLCVEAVRIANSEGCPAPLREGLLEAENILREMDQVI